MNMGYGTWLDYGGNIYSEDIKHFRVIAKVDLYIALSSTLWSQSDSRVELI